MPFTFTPLELPEILLVEARVFGDGRGSFMESYKRGEFAAAGITADFNQDNRSRSSKGVLRGLHYQLPPFEQAKLVRCARGRIYDVVVDARRSSPTFGKWLAAELDDQNGAMLFIPAGFAHGFQALEDDVEVVYKVTNEYDKASERGVAWDDPELDIPWPILPPLLSPKDTEYPPLAAAEVFP